jgi:putative two-component system response regulator
MKISRTTRLVLVLLVGNAAALILGLWLQDRFVASMIAWEQAEQLETARQLGHDQAVLTPNSSAPVDSTLSETTNSTAAPIGMSQASVFWIRAISMFWIIGLQSIVTWLVMARVTTDYAKQRQSWHDESLMKTRELIQTRDAIVFGLAKLAESRDPETGQHLERIALYSTRLASAALRTPKYRNQNAATLVKTIGISSSLHDIGKVGIEDAILLKPGRLTPQERIRMQEHARLGGECIRMIEHRLGHSNFLAMAGEIAFHHHERWDGNGYPAGLAGDQIPLAARIVAIADVYDALSSRRVYKEAYSHDECVEIISEEAGKQFDPDLVHIFLKIEHQFREICQNFSDNSPHANLFSLPFSGGESNSSPALYTNEKESLVTAAK